jgi:hypothetical protein
MIAEILIAKVSLEKHRDLNHQLQRLSIEVEEMGNFYVYTTKVDYRHVTRLLDILKVRYGVRINSESYMLDSEVYLPLN